MDNLDNVNVAGTVTANMTWARYAGFWSRFFAYIIDAIIIAVLFAAVVVIPLIVLLPRDGSSLSPLVYPLMIITIFLIYLLYESTFLSSVSMATPGKKLIGIKVTDMNGNKISFARALIRAIFKYGFSILGQAVPILCILSWVPLINAFLIVLTEKKQAIHDFVAGTVVVQK
jgi:uncharacterized RDD family membrane protein YckC